MQEKLKGLLADDGIYTAVLLVLIAVVSFGLGRKSVAVEAPTAQSAGVVFSEAAEIEPQSAVVEMEAKVVASKSGTKYHLPNCPGASQIKDANKITFNSISEAEAAGYTPAANCPGLR